MRRVKLLVFGSLLLQCGQHAIRRFICRTGRLGKGYCIECNDAMCRQHRSLIRVESWSGCRRTCHSSPGQGLVRCHKTNIENWGKNDCTHDANQNYRKQEDKNKLPASTMRDLVWFLLKKHALRMSELVSIHLRRRWWYTLKADTMQ